MFYLGKVSKRRAEGVNSAIMLTVDRYLEISPMDITVTWMGGRRTAEQQNAIFKEGNSQRDGFTKQSYHQTGDALDVAPYIANLGIAKSKKASLTVAYFMLKAFSELKSEGIINGDLHLHSGIFWGDKDLDGDGFLTEQDKIGWDSRHFEIREYPQNGTYAISV